MNKLFTIFKDILYVSKLTKTKNKKILILLSIVFSQLTAGTDLMLIGIFASIIANQFTNVKLLNDFLVFFNENRVFIVILIFIRYLINYFQFSILKKIEVDVITNIKTYMFEKVLQQKNYSRSDTYYFIDTLSTHISFFYSNFALLLNSFLQTIAYVFYLIVSDASLVTYFGLGVLLLSYPIYKLIKVAKNYMHEKYYLGIHLNKELVNAVENLPLIKILRMEKVELSNYYQSLKKSMNITFKNYQLGFVNQQLPNFFTLTIFAILLNIKLFYGRITLDFLGVTIRLFQSLSNITNSLSLVVNSQIHIEEFVKLEKTQKIRSAPYFIKSEIKKIELKKVNFKYSTASEFIFKDLNLSFDRNTHNIIVGANGSGKSTILGLIGNVLTPEEGVLYSFTEKFSYIGAAPFIFTKTLRENVTYGNNSTVNDEEIIKILKVLDVFKEQSSYNLDKNVDNTSLSSGQMQKIAFARTLLANPDVLLLDEALANLDDNSTELILDLLEKQNVTVINSTHDPQFYKNIDRVYKIELENENRRVIVEK